MPDRRTLGAHLPAAPEQPRQGGIAGSRGLKRRLVDLHANPDRLLDGSLRASMHALAGRNQTLVSTLRLLEELALVGGFTVEQVCDANSISEVARRVLESHEPQTQEVVHIGLTQTVPCDASAATTHLPHLLLASQRTGTSILLTNAPGHALAVRVTPEAAVPTPAHEKFVLGVGPDQQMRPGPTTFPARVEVNKTSRTIRFYLGRFGGTGPSPSPLPFRYHPNPAPTSQRAADRAFRGCHSVARINGA